MRPVLMHGNPDAVILTRLQHVHGLFLRVDRRPVREVDASRHDFSSSIRSQADESPLR